MRRSHGYVTSGRPFDGDWQRSVTSAAQFHLNKNRLLRAEQEGRGGGLHSTVIGTIISTLTRNIEADIAAHLVMTMDSENLLCWFGPKHTAIFDNRDHDWPRESWSHSSHTVAYDRRLIKLHRSRH